MTIPARYQDQETLTRLARFNQIRHEREITYITKLLEDLMIIPMTDIWIYSNYPNGFEARVGGLEIDEYESNDWVFVITYEEGAIDIKRHRPAGIYPNGSLRI